MRLLECPECKVMMQPFFAKGISGGLVELDRCAKCTRIWFDVKELETAVGKAFLPRLRGSAGSHECPVCKVTLGTSLIRGDVPIEECGTCGGALLDAHDFELISGGELREVKPPPPPLPKKAAAKVVEFTCAKCRKRFPIAEAGNVNGATVCRSCELEPWPEQPKWYSDSGGPSDLDDVTDWLTVIGSLFNR